MSVVQVKGIPQKKHSCFYEPAQDPVASDRVCSEKYMTQTPLCRVNFEHRCIAAFFTKNVNTFWTGGEMSFQMEYSQASPKHKQTPHTSIQLDGDVTGVWTTIVYKQIAENVQQRQKPIFLQNIPLSSKNVLYPKIFFGGKHYLMLFLLTTPNRKELQVNFSFH